jgi:hypothetical protein
MSNGLAISAVTLTLQNLIRTNVPELQAMSAVTALPPDKVTAGDADQLNLFLYHVMPNAAWRNFDMPRQVRPGEKAQPPLPLILDYLITAYGKNDHALLGKTMSAFHDHPLLSPDEINAVLPASELNRQAERVRLTLQPLSHEDMYRLWSGFQTQYRISAAYQVSVVLIESTRLVNAALPVLQRGEDDQGPQASAGSSPVLTALVLPDLHSSARLGETIVIQGQNLTTENVSVRFVNRTLQNPIQHEIVPTAGDVEGELKVELPNTAAAMSEWVPGLYTVALVVKRPNLPAWTTNELPLGIAPLITRAPTSVVLGDTLTVTSTPRVRDGQRVLMVIGSAQAAPDSITNDPDLTLPSAIDFTVPTLQVGSYVVRLRVDGIDSIPVIRQGAPSMPAFDPDQMVQVNV